MENIKFNDAFETDSCITVCVELTKEDVAKIFTEAGQSPKNNNMEPNDNFVSGEIQYVIYKNSSNEEDLKVEEVLIWPTYSDEEGNLENGDFINAGDSWWEYSKEAIEFWKNTCKAGE